MAIPFEGQEATKLFLKITWREWPVGVADEDLLLGYENTTTIPRRLDGGWRTMARHEYKMSAYFSLLSVARLKAYFVN